MRRSYRIDSKYLTVIYKDRFGEDWDANGEGKPCRTIQDLQKLVQELYREGLYDSKTRDELLADVPERARKNAVGPTIRFPEDYKKTYVAGVGRHRRKIDVYACKQCGKEMHFRRFWIGSAPRMAVECIHCAGARKNPAGSGLLLVALAAIAGAIYLWKTKAAKAAPLPPPPSKTVAPDGSGPDSSETQPSQNVPDDTTTVHGEIAKEQTVPGEVVQDVPRGSTASPSCPTGQVWDSTKGICSVPVSSEATYNYQPTVHGEIAKEQTVHGEIAKEQTVHGEVVQDVPRGSTASPSCPTGQVWDSTKGICSVPVSSEATYNYQPTPVETRGEPVVTGTATNVPAKSDGVVSVSASGQPAPVSRKRSPMSARR